MVHAKSLCVEQIHENVVVNEAGLDHGIWKSTYWSCGVVEPNFRIDI